MAIRVRRFYRNEEQFAEGETVDRRALSARARRQPRQQTRRVGALVGVRRKNRRRPIIRVVVKGREAAEHPSGLALDDVRPIGGGRALRGLHQFFREHRVGQSPGRFVGGEERACRAHMIGVVADPFARAVRMADDPFQLVDRGGDEKAGVVGIEVGRAQTCLD